VALTCAIAINVRMSTRFRPLVLEELKPAQREAHDAWLKGRGAVRGPVNVLLRVPNLAKAFERAGATIRFESIFPPVLLELAIIIVARAWTAQFEWCAHRRLALQAGLSPEKCQAIADGRRPPDLGVEESEVFDFVSSLLGDGNVSDDIFSAIVKRHGESGAAQLIGLVGYYSALALILNVDGQPVPDGDEPLKPLDTMAFKPQPMRSLR
jgi:4-carboxymuconolactone decarboxylase